MSNKDSSDWGMRFRHGVISSGPIPTQRVSNEEFVPLPQTGEQLRAVGDYTAII